MPASFESIKPVNLDFPWLQAFTVAALRSDGTVADFTAGSAVGEASRRELEAELSPLSVTWLALEHGLTVARVPAQNSQQIKSLKSVTSSQNTASPAAIDQQDGASQLPTVPADAAWVIEPGTAAAFTTADCLPIILASERIHCAAAIHAGWRSLAAGIITSVANSEFSPQPGTLAGFKAWIGPAISAADYEVDTVTRRRFLDCDPALDEYFQPTSLGHYLADLQGIATYGLLANGVAPGDIAVCSTSTYQTANLHSARRDGPTSGRMATVVGLNHINLS